jgi:hypothetical protein
MRPLACLVAALPLVATAAARADVIYPASSTSASAPATTTVLGGDAVAGVPMLPSPDTGWDAALSASGGGGTQGQTGAVGLDGYAAARGDAAFDDGTQVLSGAVATGGSVRVRGGELPLLELEHWAHLDWRGRGAASLLIPRGSFEHQASLGAVPSLFARRDLARGTFGREQLGGAMSASFDLGGSRLDLVEVGFGDARTVEAGAPVHHQTGAHGVVARYCRGRADGPDACLDAITIEMLGVEGGSGAALGVFYPVRVRGLGGHGWYLDAGAGSAGLGTLTSTVDNNPPTIIHTDDLPDLHALVYDLHLAGSVGPLGLDARARREAYLTVDGDLSLESRAEAAAAWRAGPTTVTLRGFAARTTWWTHRTDPGTTGVTGGGALDVAGHDHGVAWDASVAVAQSYYAALTGEPPPALGAQAMLELHRSVRTR